MSAKANIEATAKRGPGRPRKDPSQVAPAKTTARKTATVSQIGEAKRGPGRPRKERPEPVAQVNTGEPKRARGLFEVLPKKQRDDPKKGRAYVVSKFTQLLDFQPNVAGVYYHKIIDKIKAQNLAAGNNTQTA